VLRKDAASSLGPGDLSPRAMLGPASPKLPVHQPRWLLSGHLFLKHACAGVAMTFNPP
tara:strand:- start:38379 stop:38552 length:174 start_codon:yes stop_codon:yes gene_type:complete